MDEQNKNLIFATVLSFLVILVWFWLFPPEEMVVTDPPPQTTEAVIDGTVPNAASDIATTSVPTDGTDAVAASQAPTLNLISASAGTCL